MKTILEYIVNNHISDFATQHNLKELSHNELNCLTNNEFVIYAIEMDENDHSKDIAYYIIDVGDDTIGKPFGQETYEYNAVSQDLEGRMNKYAKVVLTYLSNKTGIDTNEFWITYCKTSSLLDDIKNCKDVKIYRLAKK